MPKPLSMGKRVTSAKRFIFDEHLIQLILLVIAVFIVTSWINYHFEGAAWLSALLYLATLLYSMFGLLTHVSTSTDAMDLRTKIQNLVVVVLRPSVLIILYITILT